MKDQEILNNAPEGNYKSVCMLSEKPAIWVPETYRSLADIKELVELRKENEVFRFKFAMTEISLKTRTSHLTSCEAALESRDKLNESLVSENKELKSGCREHQIYYVMRTKLEEAETQNQRLKVIVTEREASIDAVAKNILDMDNCEQDSDEMDEYWTDIKEFALLTTGRVDS
jgi:hypothetical protein